MVVRLLRRDEVERLTGLHRATIYAMMQRGEFPRPVKLTERAVAWPESTILDWIAARMRASGYREEEIERTLGG